MIESSHIPVYPNPEAKFPVDKLKTQFLQAKSDIQAAKNKNLFLEKQASQSSILNPSIDTIVPDSFLIHISGISKVVIKVCIIGDISRELDQIFEKADGCTVTD
jgi:hypothetical protein